jgi:hypothetical protein
VKRDHLTPSPSLSRRERDRRSPLPHLPNVQTPRRGIHPPAATAARSFALVDVPENRGMESARHDRAGSPWRALSSST